MRPYETGNNLFTCVHLMKSCAVLLRAPFNLLRSTKWRKRQSSAKSTPRTM